jgi:hypothetical protein
MREASIPGKSVTPSEIPADSSGGRERFPGDSGISTRRYEHMEEYRRQTERGEILYRLKDTPSGKKKLEITYPGGHVSEMAYEIESFHLMDWGYVEEMDDCLSINMDWNVSLWRELSGTEIFEKGGLYGCRRSGKVVFPPIAEQLEVVEGGRGIFIMKGRRYALLHEYGRSTLSDKYDRENGFFFSGGKEGWHKDGKTIIPAEYDSIDKWWGLDVYRVEKDGKYSYVNSAMEPLFDGMPGVDGFERAKEAFPYPTDGEHNLFVTTRFALPDEKGCGIVLSDSGERIAIGRMTRDMIRERLTGGRGDLVLTRGDLALFDDDFSYEFSAYEARTRSASPVEDLLGQFARLGAHSNSWHYIIGLKVPEGNRLPSARIRYLRHYFETLSSQTLSLKVSVTEDPSVPEGEVHALMVTHYNERCFPAMFESDWIDDFNNCTLEEILVKEKELKAKIREEVKEEYRDEVYRDQFVNPFCNVRYNYRRSWKESRKVLDWFLGHNPSAKDYIHSFVQGLEHFYMRETVGSLEYYTKVILWALSKGGNVNLVSDGKTPLDRLDGTLAIDWAEGTVFAKRSEIPHFERKLAIVRKCRAILVIKGAKTLSQLRAEERLDLDAGAEIRELKAFCSQK